MSIGKRMQALREAKALSQTEAAERIGKTQNFLSLLENDKREPSLSTLNALADLYEAPLAAFFFDPRTHALVDKLRIEFDTVSFRRLNAIVQDNPEAGIALAALLDAGLFETSKGCAALQAIASLFIND